MACMLIDDWQTAFAEYCFIMVLDIGGDKFQTERSILQVHIQNYVQTQKSRKGCNIHLDFPLHTRYRTDEYEAHFLDKETSLDNYPDESDVDWGALNEFYGQTLDKVDNTITPLHDKP